MDSGQSTKHHHPAPIKVRAPRLAGIQFSEDSVTNELRTLFLREVERATPEVLEKLRQKVWPEYIKAYEAIQQSGFTPTSVLFPSRSADRQKTVVDCSKAVVDWAKEVRLLYGDGPPTWVVQQVETTLQIWTRHPGLDVKGCAVVAFGRVQVGTASATRLSNRTTPFHMVLAIRLRKCAGRKKAHY